jgi:hypothetical protein
MNSPHEPQAKAKAKVPVQDVMAMLRLRALSLMPRRAQALIGTQLDEEGNLTAKSDKLPADVAAARKQYSRTFVAVEKWWRDRTKNGAITYRLPDYVALQPDLSDSEKFLLADVAYLQATDDGCYKGNASFAIELGLSERVVKNMISRLKATGFLVVDDRDGRRYLRVNIDEGKSVNKTNQNAARAQRAGSQESDQEVTGKLPSDHRNVTAKSPRSDEENVNKQRPTPDNTGRNASHRPRHPSGDMKKTTTTTEGAAPHRR